MSSIYSRIAIDCLMEVLSGKSRIGIVRLGFPGATNSK